MKVSIKLFASYREAYGQDEVVLELPQGTTCAQVQAHLVRESPQLDRWSKIVRFGVNCQFVPPQTALVDGDELVLIPPVSGG